MAPGISPESAPSQEVPPTARRGSLVAREYSEAQHLEILMVIDAGRASRVRAGELDRLGLYATVAARSSHVHGFP